MTKFWIYLAVYLIGAISGIILWEKIGTDDVYRGVFRFKQKGKQNVQEPTVNLKLERKQTRKEKREQRKLDKLKN